MQTGNAISFNLRDQRNTKTAGSNRFQPVRRELITNDPHAHSIIPRRIVGRKLIIPKTQPFLFVLSPTNSAVVSYGCKVANKTEFLDSAKLTEEEFQENPIINWDAILWVNRSTELWAVQLVLALISLTEALLIAYLGYKVSCFCLPGAI